MENKKLVDDTVERAREYARDSFNAVPLIICNADGTYRRYIHVDIDKIIFEETRAEQRRQNLRPTSLNLPIGRYIPLIIKFDAAEKYLRRILNLQSTDKFYVEKEKECLIIILHL
jgi:hypothetical protein